MKPFRIYNGTRAQIETFLNEMAGQYEVEIEDVQNLTYNDYTIIVRLTEPRGKRTIESVDKSKLR